MKRSVLALACLLASTATLAASPLAQAGRRPPPCQRPDDSRDSWPNGTMLWGTARKAAEDETSTVLRSLSLDSVRLGRVLLQGVHLQDGRLVAPPHGPGRLVGAMLKGKASDGQPVEVALCSAEPDERDPGMERYRIEVWREESAGWVNPCMGTNQVPTPRALAVSGVWDETGAHHDVAGEFTFACETGAIAKCAEWGYKPWAKKDGRSLAELHQACTRMVRADYCGDGRSHTHAGIPIDMYDDLGVLGPAVEDTPLWKRELGSFEAAWGPEGARCLAHTRDGLSVEALMAQCPGRFEAAVEDLGAGDRCTVRRQGPRAVGAPLRNHSYGLLSQASSPK